MLTGRPSIAAPPGGPNTPPTIFAASARASLASIVGQAPGFVVPVLIASALGATWRTDAFFLALSLASFPSSILAAAGQQASIPFIVERAGEGRNAFGSEVSGLMLLGSIGLVGTLWLLAPVLIDQSVVMPEGGQPLVRQLLGFFVPMVVLGAMASAWIGALNSERCYVVPPLSQALRTLPVVGLLLAFPGRLEVFGLAGGYVAGEVARVAILAREMARHGLRACPVWPSRASRQFLWSGGTQVAGAALLGVTTVIDRLMVSTLGPGSVSLLEYAERAWQVPVAMAMSGFVVVSVTEWSHGVQLTGSTAALTRRTTRTALLLFGASLPVCAVTIMARRPLTELVFGYGRLSAAEVGVLADVFAVFLLGLPLYVLGVVYTRAFLVLKRSDLLLGINLVQLAVKVAVNWLAIPAFGIAGAAASSATMYALATLLLVIGYHGWLGRPSSRAVAPAF